VGGQWPLVVADLLSFSPTQNQQRAADLVSCVCINLPTSYVLLSRIYLIFIPEISTRSLTNRAFSGYNTRILGPANQTNQATRDHNGHSV
jgi:hypothetical protein